MPQIVVTVNGADTETGREVFRERVARADLDHEVFASQLIERLAWALEDADSITGPDLPAADPATPVRVPARPPAA